MTSDTDRVAPPLDIVASSDIPKPRPTPSELLRLYEEYYLEALAEYGYDAPPRTLTQSALTRLAEHLEGIFAPPWPRPMHLELHEHEARELAIQLLTPRTKRWPVRTVDADRIEVSQIVDGGMVHVQIRPSKVHGQGRDHES